MRLVTEVNVLALLNDEFQLVLRTIFVCDGYLYKNIFGTAHTIFVLLHFPLAATNARTSLRSHRCSHSQCTDVDEDLYQNLDFYPA